MKKYIFLILTLIGFSANLQAEIPVRPDPPRLVNDFAGILQESEAMQLEDELVRFDRETSTQVVIVTVPDLEGYDPADYAFRIGEAWGVGQKGKNNGVVILVKPKQGNSKGQIFIATGYGLEAVLPDAVVNGAIIDNEIIPYFKENNYYKGLSAGIKVIMEITRGEYTADEYKEFYAKQNDGLIPALLIVFFLIILPLLRGRSRRFYSPGKSLPFWLALGMLSGSHRSGGSFGNFSSGSGGFGGFGGGSFGGGGAGGSW